MTVNGQFFDIKMSCSQAASFVDVGKGNGRESYLSYLLTEATLSDTSPK